MVWNIFIQFAIHFHHKLYKTKENKNQTGLYNFDPLENSKPQDTEKFTKVYNEVVKIWLLSPSIPE